MPKSASFAVKSVRTGSLAHKAGIRPGDLIVSLNGHPVRDALDFQFHAAEEELDITIRGNGESFDLHIQNPRVDDLGLRFDPMPFQGCGNHCVFCFIDQNPPGMRESLYLKDEDYRLSFLYGNYVTLTTVKQDDLDRIVDQRLSPLYISIHATETEPRQKLLGIRRDDGLLDKIDFLVKHGIELHGQIVLCPGINDGRILRISLKKLSEFHPGLRTVSIVPVGLTKHRQALPSIRPVDPGAAEKIVRQIEERQKDFKNRLGEPFVYLSDELYLKAGWDIPPSEHYGDYWQIDNGVGMIRSFLDGFAETADTFPASIKRPKSVVIATGASAAPVVEKNVLPKLNRIRGIHASVQTVPNRFFGETVTVSGLLTGQDIASAFETVASDETVALPSNLLNADGLMLDDWTPGKLSKAIDRKVVVLEDFEEFWKRI